eukprot:UN29826
MGDLGVTNGQSGSYIANQIQNYKVDMIIHAGDFGYDLWEENGKRTDQYFEMVDPITSYVPYMTAHGNHEFMYDFSHYTHSFRLMPSNSGCVNTYNGSQVVKSPNNWFYSFEIGLVHFIAISSEIYFTYPDMIETQYNWIKQDLEKAVKNRKNIPWIMVFGHRPLYCSSNTDKCGDATKLLREGPEGHPELGLEALFHQYGVEFYICGHNHNYERLYDIYNFTTEHKSN